ncbi:MAG: ABC transporter permease [Oscillospiraceae bacterium]|nr:ABC transporter permease [Oscillospiraceae bacterium]
MQESTVAKVPKKNTASKKENRAKTICVRLFKNKLAIVAAVVLVLIILLALFAPYVTPYQYDALDIANKNQGPSLSHWFGTDDLGRDILSRVIYGGRYSLTISVIAVICAVLLGIIIGAAAGYFGGTCDNILMRILDVFQAIPDLILTIAISAALGSGFDKTVMALAISRIPTFSSILRANILTIRNQEYVEAAEAIGCSRLRCIRKYILPNSWTPLIVTGTMQVANVILSLATLSYIGLGIQAPLPEWGAMLSAARGYVRDYPYQLIFPGCAIAVSVLCLNILGDGLRDALDPKLKN